MRASRRNRNDAARNIRHPIKREALGGRAREGNIHRAGNDHRAVAADGREGRRMNPIDRDVERRFAGR